MQSFVRTIDSVVSVSSRAGNSKAENGDSEWAKCKFVRELFIFQAYIPD